MSAVKSMLVKRASLRSKITRSIQKDINSMVPLVVQDTLNSLVKLKEDIENVYEELFQIEEDEKLEERIHERDEDCERIDEFRRKLLEAQSSTSLTPSSTEEASTSSCFMPISMSIPPFDGDAKQWSSFHDLFQIVIENKSLSDAQRLQYLKTVTTGKAAKLLEPFSVTDANFSRAWGALEERFKDTTSTVYAHIDTILEYSCVKDSFDDLTTFIDSVRSACLALEALKRPITNSDLIVRILENKLHCDTLQAWRLSISSDMPPTYEELITFLVKRSKALVNAPSSTSQTKQSFKRLENKPFPVKQSTYSCPVCNSNHKLNYCEKFKKLTVEDRRLLVRRKQLCFNCLRGGHGNKECTWSSCKTCQKKHNTLLHLNQPVQSNSVVDKNDHGLLPTAVVNVKAADGTFKQLRALLDTGSMASMITKEAADSLNLERLEISKHVS